jgi:alanyl-tRNA synthetase
MALKQVLGDHARQAGSLVAPDRFRFDFTHPEAMTSSQLREVEKVVNQAILNNHNLVITRKIARRSFGRRCNRTIR